MLTGRMMDFPLTLTHFLDRARTYFGQSEIVSRQPDRSLHRYTYADFSRRARQLAEALTRLGVKPGDRVASLCWNHYRHLELYFAVPAMGAVLHTLNLRLHPNDLGYIARHAEDRFIVVDRSLLPLLEKFIGSVPSVAHIIVVPDDGPAPEGRLDYERLLAAEPGTFVFPPLEERSAAMLCYTSGTTGNPKGVLYTHRSIVLHTLAECMADTFGIGEADAVMPVVPMFHAAAWGMPFAGFFTGSKIVLPGPHLEPTSLLDLMAAERVTLAAGVPTIWLGILALLDQEPSRWDLKSVRGMLIGGSAAPQAMIEGFQNRHGLAVTHAWGMTELQPVGTIARPRHSHQGKSPAERFALRATQGYALPFVEVRHVSDSGEVLPWDGTTMGELEVRGPWVASSYYGDEGADRFTPDGWFKTGDVVTLDAEGFVRITDRSKDVIKSGGEWISSVALENALMAHPAVLEAAVFAAKDTKWDERPLAAVVLKPGQSATREQLAAHLETHFAKWWLPEDYVFLAQIPRTSTGKFLKTKLREDHGDHLLKRANKER
ncbi:long-chain fatty acid--CoA ligase [Melittangium boletus]|uniref:Long-chain-fatty-acid--CoA ligase n=1 Tax=Melittangium boletus DSM 14713 TaxID=1294270 RepID=A0A250IFY0_9BACT|nr:long-chain fatty acid--CoA ligase [Melittangium boletus]ATB30051.1 long-chain-fatty-acid--CoA ligase [Melittangium boletus DSM 14713]